MMNPDTPAAPLTAEELEAMRHEVDSPSGTMNDYFDEMLTFKSYTERCLVEIDRLVAQVARYEAALKTIAEGDEDARIKAVNDRYYDATNADGTKG